MKMNSKNNARIQLLLKMLSPFKRKVLLVLLSALIVSAVGLTTPLIQRTLMDDGILKGQWDVIIRCSLFSLLLFFISQGTDWVQYSCTIYMQKMLSFRLFNDALRHIFRLPAKYFTETNNAQIINNVSSDIGKICGIANELVIIAVVQILKMIGGIVGLSMISWKLGLIVLVSLPFKILCNIYFTKKQTAFLSVLMKKYSAFYRWLGDIVSGISVIKLWGNTSRQMSKYTQLQRDVIKNEMKMEYARKAKDTSTLTVDQFLQTALYIIGSYFILKNQLSLGSFFAFTTYTAFVSSTISFLINVQSHFIEIGPSVERHSDFMALAEEPIGHLPMPATVEAIRLSHVSFQYGDVPVFEDISLDFNKGEVIAIVGPNGSGKSSLMQLLLRLYMPTEGEILINNININDILLDEYRLQISVIEQKPYLFDGTVYENIAVSSVLSREEIAAEFTRHQLKGFLDGLPDGLDTYVGVGGAKLSGGERQKIAALRATMKPCQILILDEATSNYDIESERALQDIVLNGKADRITFIVTHKQAFLYEVDRVIRLDELTKPPECC